MFVWLQSHHPLCLLIFHVNYIHLQICQFSRLRFTQSRVGPRVGFSSSESSNSFNSNKVASSADSAILFSNEWNVRKLIVLMESVLMSVQMQNFISSKSRILIKISSKHKHSILMEKFDAFAPALKIWDLILFIFNIFWNIRAVLLNMFVFLPQIHLRKMYSLAKCYK